MSNADVIIEILAEEGVEYLAGFPNNRLFNSAAAHSIRPIIARTERVAINMADAYTRMNNGKKIGVIAVQDGPGIEASFSAVAQAYGDNTPILMLPGAHILDIYTVVNHQLLTRLSKRLFQGNFETIQCITQTTLVVRLANEPRLSRIRLYNNTLIMQMRRQPVIEAVIGCLPIPIIRRWRLTKKQTKHACMPHKCMWYPSLTEDLT